MSSNQFLNGFKRFITPAMLACSAALLAGCGDSEIKTYRVAKDDSQPSAPVQTAGGPMAGRPALPHLHSEVPEGWRELPPDRMRLASYQITGDNGQTASVSVTPLPNTRGIGLQSVNMWRREELGLAEITAEELKEQAQPVAVGDVQGILVDIASEGAGDAAVRIIGALAERENIMWFVKMTGSASLVAEQKQNFVAYLKSLEFHDESHDQPRQAVASAEQPVSTNTDELPPNSDAPKFEAPDNWSEKAPGPMITSAYTVTGGEGQAEVTISKFPGPVGGMVPNINRWRGQLGLAPLPQAEAAKSAEMIEVGGEKTSYLVDVKGTNARTGKPARLVAVGVPHGGDTWFFKLLGDEALVAKEKDAFVQFIVGAY